MSNTRGSGSPITTERHMAMFDQLPRSVRAAYANAVEDWHIGNPLRSWKSGRYRPSELIASLARSDAAEIAKREEQRRTARGPYRGNIPDTAPMMRRKNTRRK